MDPSKFSLKHASQVLQPQLEHLSFKRLRDCLESFTNTIAGVEYHLDWTRATVLLPACMDEGLEEMVHVIPIGCRILGNVQFPRRFEYERLFLWRIKGADYVCHWLYQRADFIKAPMARTYFQNLHTKIVFIDDDDLAKAVHPPANFPEKFWTEIGIWAQESMEVRTKALMRLSELNALCTGILSEPVAVAVS